jgi:hypothetical protein
MKSSIPGWLTLAVLAVPTVAMAVTPIDSGPIPGSVPVTIAASQAKEVGVRVDGNTAVHMLISFDSAGQIASYRAWMYDFISSALTEVPLAAGEWAGFASVSEGRVVLTRGTVLEDAHAKLDLYDIASNTFTTIDPDLKWIIWPAIGGDVVAYLRSEQPPNTGNELHVASLSAGTRTVIASGFGYNGDPDVSPNGDVIVWNQCPGAVLGCGTYKALRSGSGWAVSPVLTSAQQQWSPSTDGTVIAYACVFPGEVDICWQPVGGGAEMRLEMAGKQDFPQVAAGSIVFRCRPEPDDSGLPADICLYETASNRLFRITDTPDFEDQIPDVTRLSDGRMRVVWSGLAASDWNSVIDELYDVFGVTFSLPPTQPPTFTFGGFLQPVDPLPALNSMRAGGAVPVKFSLGGYHGLGVFAAGYPKSQAIACNSTAPELGIEQTVSAGGSSLTYDASTDAYTYVWKTDRAWAGTCRQLVLGFSDGTFFRANFKFK